MYAYLLSSEQKQESIPYGYQQHRDMFLQELLPTHIVPSSLRDWHMSFQKQHQSLTGRVEWLKPSLSILPKRSSSSILA
jgi:hypothetical protein